MPTTDLSHSLDKLFTAFPLHYHSDEARAQRKHQYQLYHERLRGLPRDLVERTVLELIDTATHMPRIGTIRARVQARIKHRVNLAAPSTPRLDDERSCRAQPLAETRPVAEQSSTKRSQPPASATGPCPGLRGANDADASCRGTYEYTEDQVRWLRGQGERLLCTRCAGKYLARQEQLRRQEAAWAEALLSELSYDCRPSPEEVQRLRSYGFGQQLHECLVAIGAYSNRRIH